MPVKKTLHEMLPIWDRTVQDFWWYHYVDTSHPLILSFIFCQSVKNDPQQISAPHCLYLTILSK